MRNDLHKLLTFLFVITTCSAQGIVIDSLQSPKLWLEQQNTIGRKLLKTSHDFDKTVKLFKSAYDFATEQGLSNQFPEISIGYGISMYKNGDIQNSHTILSELLPKLDESKLKLKAEVNQILGMTFIFKDKFTEGYKHQMDALKYYSDIGDSTGLMSVYYDLGSNFANHGQSELALKNYEKGIAIAKSTNDVKMTILGITALGSTWADLNDYEKALKYSSESIELAKSINDDEELAWASIHRGHTLLRLEKYEEAEFYLNQSYDLSFKIGNKLLTAYALEQLSDINIRKNRLTEGITKLDESLEIYEELGQVNNIKEVTKKYAEIYYKQKNFTKYKEYTDQYIALKDSIYSKDMMNAMADLKQDFEIHKLERENQIALLTKDQEIANANSYATIVITCGTVVIFILLLILMYIRNKATIERNELLSAKNAEIVRQNECLANSNRDLEKFAYIISHDLKEPLRNINGFTKLLNRKLSKYTVDQDISDYASFITDGTEQMAKLLNGLLEYSKVSVNKREKEVIDLNVMVRDVLNNLKIQQREKSCEIEVQTLPSILCRSMQLTQVFQNLVANAIKFGSEEGNKITIGVEDFEDEYRFFVKDEGIGIDPEFQKDIFIVFKRLHDRGTYTGSGIGLATCKKIVEDHYGDIWVESKVGEGSCFYFTLPKEHDIERALPNIITREKTLAEMN